MKLNCKFNIFKFPKGDEFYQCKVLKIDQEIHQLEELEFIGQHLPEKSNSDVTFVEFCDTNCPKVPQGLTKIFPNLKALGFYNSKLKELNKADLAEYKSLVKFISNRNLIDFLSGDLFEGFKDLKHIDFYDNKLGIIEPNLLDSFDDLDYVSFIGNPQYATSFDKSAHYLQYTTLNDVKNHLFERFFHLKFEIFSDFVKKYPEPEQILKFYGQKASNYYTRMSTLETKYRLYDELRPQEIEEFEEVDKKLREKCVNLEDSNLELSEKLEALEHSKLKMDEKIKQLKIELQNEKQEKVKLNKNLQKQIDSLAQQIQSALLVNFEK
ncbi:hypothetical protein ACKWTF_015308 [Chironomus riparius]